MPASPPSGLALHREFVGMKIDIWVRATADWSDEAAVNACRWRTKPALLR
jgi:hypothetical protein